MSEVLIVGIMSGVLGVLAAAIPAYLTSRNAPSRRVSDSALIVDASGQVIMSLREEIDRLDGELDESRARVTDLEDEVSSLHKQVDHLEAQLYRAGLTPERFN